jgi:hypothetical protein
MNGTAVFSENAVHPLVGELAAFNGCQVVGVDLALSTQTLQQFGGDFSWHDYRPGVIGNYEIARIHYYAPAANGVINLARASMERTDRGRSAGVHREIQLQDRGQIPDQAIDQEAGNATVLGLGANQVAEDRIGRSACTAVDHYHVAGTSHVQGFMHHQVVAREDFDSASGAAEPMATIRHAHDASVNRVKAVQQIRDVWRVEIHESVYEIAVQTREIEIDAKPWPWMDLGGTRLDLARSDRFTLLGVRC